MAVGLSPKEQLIQEIQETIESLQSRIVENDAILEQNRLEVERLRQRNVNVSAQLKRIEDSFDTVPRQDIKIAYEDTIEARTRLVSMQSQLEKLQDTQGHLGEFKDALGMILGMMEGVSIDRMGSGTLGSSPAPTLSLAGEQIVRIVEAQESERRRLANALHDGPAQSLTNFILQAEICQRLFDRDPDRASTELENLKDAASISFQKIREFIFDLRPMMLDDLGLVATVKRHTENLDEHNEDLHAEFHLTGAERRLPSHVEVIMFRGLQMLISNARDLMSSKNITVKLDIGENKARGSVEDDGRGFDPEVELDRDQGDSPLQNLLELQERIELVGGTLDIYSVEGEGSNIEIILPFSDEL